MKKIVWCGFFLFLLCGCQNVDNIQEEKEALGSQITISVQKTEEAEQSVLHRQLSRILQHR